jgi:DNA polymerase III sliding clamp (beta) subunit (PCNA family)
MKINKAELQNALSKVKPGLASKEIIEQSTSFAFMGDKVVTYNDEISISHPVKGLNLVGAIKAEELYQFLGKIKQDEINISWEENQFKITAGNSKAGLILQQEVKLPIEEVGEIGDWKELPNEFIEGLKFCRVTCSKDMSRPVLTCVNVMSDGTIVGSDSYRVTTYTLKEMPTKTFLIPATSVDELTKYDIKYITRGEGWVHFKTDEDTVFSCRIFEDNYPESSHIINFSGKSIRLPKKLPEVLDKAKIFAKKEFEEDSEVNIKIEDGWMTVSAEATSGWFEETIRIKYKDEPISFIAHPTFLAEMLGKVQNCILGEDLMKFEGSNWVYVTSLTIEG